jgi:hypothetical protein
MPWWPTGATILIAVPVVIILKAAVIYGILRGFGSAHDVAVRAALALPQAGEFGFVLFASAVSAGILGAETSSILVAVIALTMVASSLVERLAPLLIADKAGDEIEEDFSDAGGRALVIGFARFGEVVTQALRLRDISVTILDVDAERVREAREFGSRIHFGDGMRREVLRAAGAADRRCRRRYAGTDEENKTGTDLIAESGRKGDPPCGLCSRLVTTATNHIG